MVGTETVAEGTVSDLVGAASAAPSLHNSQPWRFRYARGTRTLALRADPERLLPQTDPEGRALHLGCGAALFNLRVAAVDAGHHPETALFPEPDDPELLATVRLGGRVEAGETRGLGALRAAVYERHTSRHPFSPHGLPAAAQAALRDAAQREGAGLSFPVGWHLELVLGLAQEAEARSLSDSGNAAELDAWTHTASADGEEKDPAPEEGVPASAYGPRRRGGKAPVRDFAGGHAVPGRETAEFEETPHLALLSTTRDKHEDWLRAGQAMQRVLLLACTKGLSSSFVAQALEWPDLRWPLREPLSAYGHIQMVLRFGYGPTGTATPRRPVEEVLTVAP